ncbi:response regulator [Marinifilum sp. D714]|uniref:hybrid sensor histidine kinase/response regulator n=1 Tax=Marinifilum sp. D714 TaxID=2937523 RepID=UPI0027C57644|nr:response regulator [Marinifilum sp. D714]MDQ2177821.1 response regulator [Marinifilum sp. D714]
MNTNSLITDISFLYELSLSVGQSLDRKENCKNFLQTLMSRKNLEFGGVWIRNYSIPYSTKTTGYTVIYSHPQIKLEQTDIEDSDFLNQCFEDKDSFSIPLSIEAREAIGFKKKERGVITCYKLQELGFVVLYTSAQDKLWNEIEQRKLKNVINKFAISVKACLFHEKSILDLITISKTQKELEKAKKEAEESNELKSAFLSNISHEFRTPINAVIGFSNLLKNQYIDSSEQKGFIDNVLNSSYKLLKMVNNLLYVSKVDSNQLNYTLKTFKINETLKEVKAHLNSQLSNKPQVNFKLVFPNNSEDVQIESDRDKLIQIMDCLADNAIKFTNAGKVELGYYIDDKSIPVFYIRDTGIGISQEKQKHIFEVFRQLDYEANRKFEGFGLGLTLCKKLIQLLKGEIWFDTEEGVGSNFYFRLSGNGRIQMDLLNDTKPNSNDSLGSINDLDFSEKNILIAEDVRSNFNYLNAIIELTDASVVWAQNGKDAIQICRHNNPKIDLVLMDIRMPEIDGLEAIKQIKGTNKSIPVIVQTAYAMNNEREECLHAGADNFITKPIDPRKLIQILQEYL